MQVKDLIKIIGSVSTVLILLFGVSLVTIFKKARIIFDYPTHRQELIDNDSTMDHAIHDRAVIVARLSVHLLFESRE